MRVRTGGALSGTITTVKSEGHIPSFASKKDKISAATELANASYANPSTRAIKDNMPGEGVYFRNSREKKVKAPGYRQPFINPPLNSAEGKRHRAEAIKKRGIDPYALALSGGASRGFIPNYAKIIDYDVLGKKKYDAIMSMALQNNRSFRHVIGVAGIGKSSYAEKLAGGKKYSKDVSDISEKEKLVFISSGVTAHREPLFRGARMNYLLKAKSSQVMKQRASRAQTGIGLHGRKVKGGLDPAHHAPSSSLLLEALMGSKFRKNSTLVQHGKATPWKDVKVYRDWLTRITKRSSEMQGDDPKQKEKRSRFYRRIGGKQTLKYSGGRDGHIPNFFSAAQFRMWNKTRKGLELNTKDIANPYEKLGLKKQKKVGKRKSSDALTKASFTPAGKSTVSYTQQALASKRPSIAKNYLPFGAKRFGNSVRLGEAADPKDKFKFNLSYYKTKDTYAQLKQKGIGWSNFENSINKVFGYLDTDVISGKYAVDGIKGTQKRRTAESKFMDKSFMKQSGFDNSYFASKQYMPAVCIVSTICSAVNPRPWSSLKYSLEV